MILVIYRCLFIIHLKQLSCSLINYPLMKHHLMLLLSLCLLTDISSAQNFEYGKINADDIALKKTAVDSSANAVMIKEFGASAMRVKSLGYSEGAGGKLYIDFEYHVKIKIFNKIGFKTANVVIPRKIYREDEEDEIVEISGTTYNYVNGNLERSELDKNNIVDEKVDKLNAVTKFTLPDLTEGCIIEYKYRIHKPYLLKFQGWDFQSDIPKLHSQYIAYIPSIYNYNSSLKGNRKLHSTKTDVYSGCIRIFGQPYDCSRLIYTMKNIPAFVEEEDMSAAENFRSAIRYELSDYYDQRRLGRKNLAKTWKDVDHELAEAEYFGGQMKQSHIFEKLLPEILNNATDSMGKATAVYDYIRKNIRPNGVSGIFGDNNIRKALREHSGNTAEINLALIAALKAAGLDTEALILSTRNNGILTTIYPVLSEFNYVVASVHIGENDYLLDASQPCLPFGLLPFQCMNGKGRIVSLKKASYWFPVKANQKESVIYHLDGELNSAGMMKGVLSIVSNGYAASNRREQITRAASIEAYVRKLGEEMPALSIVKHKVTNVDSLNNALREEYEIEVKAFDKSAVQTIFSPFVANSISKNPYNLKERFYPVDLGLAREVRLSASIKLPEEFEIADQPKDMSLVLADNGGKYIFKASPGKNIFAYSEVFQLNKAVYSPDDYLALKEFYSRIIELKKTNVILKKSI